MVTRGQREGEMYLGVTYEENRERQYYHKSETSEKPFLLEIFKCHP